MSRKNFKVATAENGKTTKQDIKHSFNSAKIDKTPTGKVKIFKDKKKIQKAREEEFINRRVNALKRRAKRMGLSDEQIEEKVKELLNQLDTPNSYTVIVFFSAKDIDLVKQALLKEDLVWKVMSNSHLIMDADQETLATIRKIMPPSAKIHPYVKKKPSVLPIAKSKAKAKRPGPKTTKKLRSLAKNGVYIAKNNDKSNTPKAIRNAKKAEKYRMHNDHKFAAEVQKKERNKKQRKIEKAYKLFQKRALKASKAKKATTVQLKSKKGSKSPKKASTNLKQAA